MWILNTSQSFIQSLSFWRLAHEDGGILFEKMEAKLFLFGKLNDKDKNPKPLKGFI